MKNERTTIHDIAKALNIDSSTVSRALNNNTRVNVKTKKRVLAKAKELGYQRNILASNLRQQKSNTIGVVVPRISRHFFSTAIAGIEETASAAGYNVVISQSLESYDREKQVIENLITNRVDGLLISITMETKDDDHFSLLKKNGIPLVFFDRHSPTVDFSSIVRIDDKKAAYDAVEHLIQQGSRKIAHFGGPQILEIYKKRLEGYKMALKDYEIAFDEDLVFISPLMESDGTEAAQKIITSGMDIDGVFSANDIAAIGAMKYFKNHGKHVPDDIAIIGFSHEPSSEVIDPALSTIDQSAFLIGKISCELLLDNIRKGEKEMVNKTVTLQSKMLIRGSSLRIKKEV